MKTKHEIAEQHRLEILPPDNRRMAKEINHPGGPLVTFRRLVEVGNSGNYIVQEGYVKEIELPDGRLIHKEIETAKLPLDWAKHNR